MTLPYDMARCNGMNAPLCHRCRRRKPGNPSSQSIILPVLTLNGCENFIRHAFLEKATLISRLSHGGTQEEKAAE